LKLLRISLAVFAFTVTLLILHHLLDIIIAFVAILGATIVLILGGKNMPELVEKIDWHTLLFLAGLFVVVGGLDKSGALADVASVMEWIGGNNLALLLTAILWISTLLSMFLDNVPFAAAMVPVLKGLAADGVAPLAPMTWSVAVAADIAGNATPIGASANVVALAIAEKHGTHIGWREYMRLALPATLLSVLVANIILVLMHH